MRFNSLALLVAVLVVGGLSISATAEQRKPASVGEAAPTFTLEDQNGKSVNLADYRGKLVVLEWWNEGCPYVQRHAKAGTMKDLAERYKEKGVVYVAINSTKNTSNTSNRKAVEQYELNYPILNDSAGTIGKAYGAKTTPHMFVIDKQGKIAYAGAIDNDPNGRNENDVNHVAKALDELLAGQTVSVAETKPYGCGVHYAN